jgi:phosphocarrier protein
MKCEFTIVNKLGLHARAAARLVNEASRFGAEITVRRDGQEANAKSIMSVMLLAASRGSVLEFEARGADAEVALRALGQLIAERFGEPE